ncbi:ribonuclease H [Daedalea quercina L-15889]|uniref:Ribonuclease H n=1 Tax=Daedalea quercina L-15889 TaxID=1314783 RepID=A0A165MWF3_9APHY|nr:ribonuclease H [Daedalea quercina L-15889]
MENGDGVNEWTKVEKRKAKKTKKTEEKMEANPPRFMYAKGEIVKRREAVGISDIRELVLHLSADAPPPSWVRVENPRSVQKVVAILVPGVTPEIISLPPLPTSATANPNLPLPIPLPSEGSTEGSSTGLPFIGQTFSHACPTRAPGDQTRMHSVLNTFFQGPITGEEKKKRIIERRAWEKTPMRYILATEQMIENDYPVPSYMAEVFEKPPGWLETPQPSTSAQSHGKQPRIYAIDCEMCVTEDGKELTRVCIIDYASSAVVYDQLVKPSKPIQDYLTRWSGITAEALDPVTTTFEEVQAHIFNLLSATPTPVLLGHSLESDLKALKICHPLCIDTSVIYHHPRGRPFKPGLAWLTKKWCGREIQNRGEGGHDPEEDARACLDLLIKKIDNGPGFGEFKIDMESILERMSRARSGGVTTAIVDHGNPAAWHGSKAMTTIACETDDEVLEGLLGAIPSHQFAFGRFTGLAKARGWITPKTSAELIPDPDPTPDTPIDMNLVLSTMNAHLEKLYASLPPRTAVIIFTGHSDPRRMSELNARKSTFETALRKGQSLDEVGQENWWTTVDGRELEEEVEKAKRGLLFLGVKESS